MHIEISHFLSLSLSLPLGCTFHCILCETNRKLHLHKMPFHFRYSIGEGGIPCRCKFYLKMQKPLSDIASDSWTTTGCIKIGNRPPGAVELLTTSNMASSTRPTPPTPHSLPLKSTCWQAASASFIRCYLEEDMAENMPLICAYTPTPPHTTPSHPELAYQKGSWLPLRGLAQNTRYTAKNFNI